MPKAKFDLYGQARATFFLLEQSFHNFTPHLGELCAGGNTIHLVLLVLLPTPC